MSSDPGISSVCWPATVHRFSSLLPLPFWKVALQLTPGLAGRVSSCSMTADLAEDQFGPAIAFREYSFLQNPQAAELNNSMMTLQVCQVGGL